MWEKIKRFAANISFVNWIHRNIFRRSRIKTEMEVFLELKKLEKLDDSYASKLQEEKLLNQLSYAYNNCPYYKRLFDQEKINIQTVNCLSKIPLLTKDIIRKYNNEMLSKSVKNIDLIMRNTGGSTGEPLEFYSDILAGAIDNAHHRYLYNLMGYKKGDVIASSGGIIISKRRRDKNIYWIKYPSNTVWGNVGYSALYLTSSNIEYYIKDILVRKPVILRGYPSFWNKIAEYILFNDIKLDFKVKGVNLTAEICSSEQMRNIEKAFSAMVYFEYGHSEISVYCYTHDSSYIYKSSPIYGYVEVIKDNGEPVEINEEGEIIVTSFCNMGMPFIRYKTDDRGIVSDKIGGIIYFSKILGRTQDYVISKDNQKVFLTALIFGQHFKAFKKISKWQLIQNEIGKLTIKIVKLGDFSQEDENEIQTKIQNITNIELNLDYVDELPLTQSGKHMFLIQNIKEL